MVPARTAHAVFILLALLALALLVVILLPLWTPLFVAAVLAGALGPATTRLAAALGERRKLAAGLLTAAVLVAVVAPLSALGAVLVPQIQAGVGWLRQVLASHALQNVVEHVPASLRPFAERLAEAVPSSLGRLQELAASEGARAATVLGSVVSTTGSVLFQSILTLVALYFLLLDGPALVEWLNEAIPVKRGQVSELLRDFRRVTVTVLVSTIATGGVQSVLATVGYYFAGVPNPIFFGVTTFIVSLIPFLGATVMVVALGLVQLLTGHTAAGVGLTLFGIGVVGMIDNVVKPLFIRGGVPIHGAVIFFALFGGLAAFGPIGFLVGPLAVTFVVAVVRMYRRDFGA
ncbi:AI-2E family transporter [Anaeromyxobacter diazotrophicus]|uniref:AI-2E family transporter n=1 Tax=Anaeromyxobacter diazotrophicus TaxID=2590199 RepID=A0A7I9VG45_9BACT|nr:AI-2E family transporter [Anaeromyxobacter diazotrophicus]GEJ55366.1 AI-2E family transporter [Anaeromyxobacter diazotrophicus]